MPSDASVHKVTRLEACPRVIPKLSDGRLGEKQGCKNFEKITTPGKSVQTIREYPHTHKPRSHSIPTKARHEHMDHMSLLQATGTHRRSDKESWEAVRPSRALEDPYSSHAYLLATGLGLPNARH